MSIIKKQTIQNIIFSYMGVVIGFVSQIFLITNFLSKEQNGLLGVLLAYMFILVQIGSLGFNSAGNRFFPYFRNEEKKHNGFIFLGLAISLLGFLFCCLILWMINSFEIPEWLQNLGFQENKKSGLFNQYFYFIYPLTFATILFNFFDNYAKNLYDTAWGTFLSQFLQRFLQFLAIGLFALQIVDYQQFMWIWLFGITFYVFPMLWKVIRLKNFSLSPNFEILKPNLRSQFIQYSGFTVLTGFSSMIIQHVDKIMLAPLEGLGQAGVYNTSVYFISVMGMALIAVNKASTPIIADALARNDKQLIQTVYQKSCLTQLVFGILVYLGIVLNFDSVFSLIKDKSYLEGKWVIIIFGLGKLFDLATGLNGTILSLSKYYKYDTISMLGLIALTIGLNLYFIPNYGIIGAAIVAAIVTIWFNLFRFSVVWFKLGYQPFNFDFVKILLFGVVSCLIVSFLPKLSGNILLVFLDISYRSIILVFLFLTMIYFSKVSIEINQLIEKGIGFLRIFAKK